MGETTVIEHLISELKRRGYHVGAIKEMVRIPTLDTPATETDRYSSAGAEIIAAIPRDETVIFVKKRLRLKEVLPFFKDSDYVILEGFKSEKTLPKIIVAKTAEEAKEYLGNLAFAISGLIMGSEEEFRKVARFNVPMFKSLPQVGELADLVEKRTATKNFSSAN